MYIITTPGDGAAVNHVYHTNASEYTIIKHLGDSVKKYSGVRYKNEITGLDVEEDAYRASLNGAFNIHHAMLFPDKESPARWDWIANTSAASTPRITTPTFTETFNDIMGSTPYVVEELI